MSMDMKISGSGKIPAGEYGQIRISGTGELFGFVRCESMKSSGAVKGDDLACKEEMKVSGSASFTGNVNADKVTVSGSMSCNDVTAFDSVWVSGSLRAKSVSAENVTVSGAVNCDGLLNAENISITYGGRMTIGSIGGGKIRLRKSRTCPMIGNVKVTTAIEGDDVELERITCPRVTGRAVSIGKGCNIDLVQYSETVAIAKKAKVNHIEKI